MARRWWRIATVGALLVAAGCAGGGNDSVSSADAGSVSRSSESAGGAATKSSADSSSGSFSTPSPASPASPAPAAQPVGIQRELVSTATMTVVARDVSATAVAAEQAVVARQGFVFGQEDAIASAERSVFTFKVPPAGFRPLLDDLGKLGKVEDRSVTTDDVTAEGVDLDARIVSAQKSVDRVRAFLDEAKNVGELSAVEGELTRRETELEQLVGQRRVLDDQVALATVTLTLSAKPAPAPPATDALKRVPGFGNALASGTGALVKAGRVAAAGAGYALPFVALFGIPFLIARRVRRRTRVVSPAA